MKKIFMLLICVLLLGCFSGCDYNAVEFDNTNSNNRMTIIYNDGFAFIYVDNETGVQYFSRTNSGSCIMVDEHGNPLIYATDGDSE